MVMVRVILSPISDWLIYVHCVPSILGEKYSRTGGSSWLIHCPLGGVVNCSHTHSGAGRGHLYTLTCRLTHRALS